MDKRLILRAAGAAFVVITASGAHAEPWEGRRFPNGERIILSRELGGMGGEGTITHSGPGQPTKRVKIGYMQGFVKAVTPTRVQYNVSGVTDKGEQSWSCEVTIDWRKAKIIAVHDLGGSGHPSCKESL